MIQCSFQVRVCARQIQQVISIICHLEAVSDSSTGLVKDGLLTVHKCKRKGKNN
eukprot:m.182237 g.182237  ORF g.182237 m.182237 type:complete len:54 (-) comp16881_c0_seq1:75-236(-)